MATRTRELAVLNPTVRDFLSFIIWGYGKGAPTDAVDGVGEASIGSLYVDITNGNLYKNTGTKASPTWNQVGGVAASEITLAEGSVLVGNSSGVGVALDASTTTQILVGNGTTITSVALSGDVTMDNTGAVTIAAGAVDQAMLAAASLDGTVAKVVADDNVIGGLMVVHRIAVASGANANYDVTLTHKTRIIDAIVVLKGAGTAGCDIDIQNVTTNIFSQIDLSAGGDKDIFRPVEANDAQHEIAAAANLLVAISSTGGDFPGAEVYVTGFRVT